MGRTDPLVAALMAHRPEPDDECWRCSCGRAEANETALYEHMADVCAAVVRSEIASELIGVMSDDLGDMLDTVRAELTYAMEARIL